MSSISVPEDKSLNLLTDSQFVGVYKLDPGHAIDIAPFVAAFKSLNQSQVANSEDLKCDESGETDKRLHQDVPHQNSFNEELQNPHSEFRIEQRQTDVPGKFKTLQVEFSNLDKVKVDLQLPEKVIEIGTSNKQPEAEKCILLGECTTEKNWGLQECQLSEEKYDVYGLPACLKKRHVAVTGAGGFIASWIVKLLLQRGFCVRGILRNIDDVNITHLKCLEGANERLELRRADILHLPSLLGVVEGCEGVFHTACPVSPAFTDPEMLRPAVEGTLNVLRACRHAHVQRVVLTSSIGAVYMNPNLPPEKVYDESCWSDENYLKDTKKSKTNHRVPDTQHVQDLMYDDWILEKTSLGKLKARSWNKEWYCLAKLMAEKLAWEYAMTHDINLVTICPGITLGTMLQPHVNQSSTHILKYLNGSAKTFANLCQAYVDVEDVAEAHILAFETQNASGRYLCCKWSRHRGEVVAALNSMYPHYPIPTRCKDGGQPWKEPLRFCSKKVEQLGLQFTSFNQTLRRAVTSLQAKGMLPNESGHPLL